MDWIWYLLLLAMMLLGLFVNILGLPGLWLLVASVAAYGWITRWDYIGWGALLTLVGLGIAAEIIEFIAGGAGAKAAGGTKRAMIGGIIGAIIGGLFLSVLPIPIISTILGACLGAFIGAAVVELAIHRNLPRAARVGTGAARGRFWGIIYKTAVGVVMFIVGVITALPIGAPRPTLAAPPPPTTTPAPTAPATTAPTAPPPATNAQP